MKYRQNLDVIGNNVYSYKTHVATIDPTNGTLTVLGYWSKTTYKHVNHVADELNLEIVKGY